MPVATLNNATTSTTDRTEVFYGQEEAMKILLQAMANVKKEAIICSDANSPAFAMGFELVKKAFTDLKKRKGVKIRQITEITESNLPFCKELMNYVELRHMDNVKGNMAVTETEYVAAAAVEGAAPLTQTIYSNVKAFLDQQRYFFENLWSKAIPAENRVKEIEEGIPAGRIEVIDNNPEEIERIYFDIIKSAKKEIMMVLPSETAFKRHKKTVIIDILTEAATKKC